MILGYTIDVPDNDNYMFSKLKLHDCAKYSDVYELNIIDPNFQLKNRKFDISCTYDGITIVSEKFKQFCIREKYEGLEFIELPKSNGFYWFKINNIVEFDAEARKTRFLEFNESCNGYEEIIGATPACLKQKTELPEGFFRSDICFGSYFGKSPLEMVGKITKDKLIDAGLKVLHFEEILDSYEWQKK